MTFQPLRAIVTASLRPESGAFPVGYQSPPSRGRAAELTTGSGTTVRSHFQRDTRSGSTVVGRRRTPLKR
jgi:hypothetical protein